MRIRCVNISVRILIPCANALDPVFEHGRTRDGLDDDWLLLAIGIGYTLAGDDVLRILGESRGIEAFPSFRKKALPVDGDAFSWRDVKFITKPVG